MSRISILLLVLSLAACKTARTKMGAEGVSWTGEPNQSVGAQILWVKNRKYEVHVSMKIHNKSDETVVLKGDWVTFEANEIAGVATKLPPAITLAPGGGKSVLMKYRFDNKVPKKGMARIVITMDEPEHIFESTLPMKK